MQNTTQSSCQRRPIFWVGFNFLPVLCLIAQNLGFLIAILLNSSSIFGVFIYGVTFLCSVLLFVNNIQLTIFYTKGLIGCHLSKSYQITFVVLCTLPIFILDLIYGFLLLVIPFESKRPVEIIISLFICALFSIVVGLIQLLVYFTDIKVKIEAIENKDPNMSRDYRQLVNPSQHIV